MILTRVRPRIGRRLDNLRLKSQLRKHDPVIVYQMGKVGSSSVAHSLERYELGPVFHAHRLNPENMKKVRQDYLDRGLRPPDQSLGEMLHAEVIVKCRKARFITLVREPIARNVSAFFENIRRFTRQDLSAIVLEELVEIFVNEYTHSVPLTWFDVEPKATIGIDVYAHSFPTERGFRTISRGGFELLVLKAESDDSVKEKAIQKFLKLEDFRLTRANVSQDKDYAPLYQDFVRNVRLPDEYVDILCESEYTRHFYSDDEIEAIRARWSDRSEKTELPPAVRYELLRASARDID